MTNEEIRCRIVKVLDDKKRYSVNADLLVEPMKNMKVTGWH